jgi:hypothetical protein
MILAGMVVSSVLIFDRNETHNIEGKQAFTAAPPRVVLTAGIRCRHRFAVPSEPASRTGMGLASAHSGCNG